MGDTRADEEETRAERTAAAAPRPPDPRPGMKVGERVRLKEPLGRGGMAEVWVADHLTLDVEVAVKFLRVSGDRAMRDRFAREAQLAARIDHPHAVRIFDHGLTDEGTPFIVMERIVGEPLSDRIRRSGAFSVDDARTIVDQVAAVLAYAHDLDIVHRDIKPHNIMVLDGPELFVKVLDFGLAKLLYDTDEDMAAITQTGWVLGTPAYMAPEQLVEAKAATQQTDSWSLAVLAYELLTGSRPFLGRVQAAIAMAMLTRRYRPLTELRPDLPGALDGFFEKAFAPDAADRFGSVLELQEGFHEALESSGARFVDGRIHLGERVYGREAELKALGEALEATKERSGMVLISGYSGVGKTALIEEGRRRLASDGIVFAYGKFDQFNRGTPYDSVVQALRELVRVVAPQDEPVLREWRSALGESLGDTTDILMELVPELADHLGAPLTQTETSPAEARNRLATAVRRLLHAVASPERPLVLFLDDLQWADLPTIDLLTRLAEGGDANDERHVLIIGSYRSNEVDAEHPLTSMVETLRGGSAFREIRLGPLGEDAVLEMVNDALGPGEGRVRLAVHCHEKTQGNPFFLRRFLETLFDEGLLHFDSESQQWTWDHSRVISRRVDDDVVDFIAAEMRRLPEATAQCLAMASCIGGHFDLGTLAFLTGTDRRRTLDRIRPALSAQLVVPGSEDLFLGDDVGPQRVTFRFAHDRIHQAAHSLLDDAEAGEAHYKVATFLLEHLNEQERQARVFELVEHLNRGAALKPALETDVARLRELNLDAARRASRAAAFEPAGDYYGRALELFDEGQWESDYEGALELHVESARSAYLNGDPEEMDRLIAVAVEHARNTIDRVKAREVSIQAHIAGQQFAEAVHLAVELLGELDAEIPEAPSAQTIEAAVGGAIGRLQQHDLAGVVDLPKATDPATIVAQRIRQSVMSAAYLSAPQLFPILPTEILRSTLEDGVVDQSAYGFAVFGMVLNAGGLIDVAYETGKMALALLDRTDDRSSLAKVRHIVVGHINPFVEPIRDCVEPERAIYQIGTDTGDLEYACWALHLMVANGFYSGMRLGALREMDQRHVALIRQHRQLPALGCTQPFSQTIRNCLGGDDAHSSRLVSADYDEDEHMAELESLGFRGAAYILTVVRTFVRFLFRELEGAVRAADAGAEFADGAVATYHQVWWRQFRALALLGSKGEGALDDAREALASLEHWASFSEVNHAHRVALLSAEIARVEGKDGEAIASYETAIAHAREHGFLHEEAIANELAARFYIERGSETAARGYLLEAREAYVEWGAQAKVEQLESELGHVLTRKRGR
jgi:predicted ATPase